MKITKTSSSRNVDAYRIGSTLEHEGQLVTVTGYRRSADSQGGYRHSMAVRPATEDEAKASKIDALRCEKRLLLSPDDYRDIERNAVRLEEIDAEIRRLEGRPTAEEEEAQRLAEIPAKVEAAMAALEIPREDREFSDWSAINVALYDAKQISKCIADLKDDYSDEQIRGMLA